MRDPRIPKAVHFGFPGFSPVQIRWARMRGRSGATVTPAPKRRPGEAYIEMDETSPLWVQVETYGHEVLHAAIDFLDWCVQEAKRMEREAEETKKELSDG